MKFPLQPLYDVYRKLIRESKYRWVIIVGTLIWLLSPINFATDIALPFIGEIDDGILVSMLVLEFSNMATEFLKARKAGSSDPASPDGADQTIDVEASIDS
jgi:uncharacterized membrane protein YkvA (DUF1232 family)